MSFTGDFFESNFNNTNFAVFTSANTVRGTVQIKRGALRNTTQMQ